jgi:hypothetical protein
MLTMRTTATTMMIATATVMVLPCKTNHLLLSAPPFTSFTMGGMLLVWQVKAEPVHEMIAADPFVIDEYQDEHEMFEVVLAGMPVAMVVAMK